MILAIFQNERVYEGNANFLNAVYPMPSLSKVVVDGLTQGLEFLGNPRPTAPPLFREDSFDPTTRIRRGRFYVSDSPDIKDWMSNRVNHYPYAAPLGAQPQSYQMNAYQSSQPAYPVAAPITQPIRLGDANCNTAWHVIGAERLFNGETLFTLKSASALGALPELDEGMLPAEKRNQIHDGFEKVVDATYKYLPVPTVDVCREFVRIMLAAWLPTIGRPEPQGNDLADVIKAIPDCKVGIKSAAAIINRLHSRGKSSEQERQKEKGQKLRYVSDEDGDLSISLVGFMLREFQWVK